MNSQAKCKDCGTTAVEWKHSKAGKWYLANIHYGIRGSIYHTPHFKNCDKSLKAREELMAAQRQWEYDSLGLDPEERFYARMERMEMEY